jgi:hypothetical protein
MNGGLKKYTWVVVIVLLVGAGLGMYYIVKQRSYTASVEIDAAPLSSTITIDGHHGHQGTTHIKPGIVTVTVARKGFKTSSTRLTISAHGSEYIGVILEPNSSDTAGWFDSHPDDQKMVEKISSRKFDINSKKQVEAEPFIKLLPYTGAGFEFQIDYGKPAPGTSKPVIIIQADTQEAKDDALLWIQGQGYDPSTMNITYTTSGYTDYQD